MSAGEGITLFVDLAPAQVQHAGPFTAGRRRLVRCEACGGLYLAYGPPGHHAARWAKVAWGPGEAPYQIDCRGRRVR